LHIADITLWEVATLVELGRIRLALPLRDWLDQATAPPLVRRVEISTAVAAEVAVLPTTFHRDPADRIIVATTKVLGGTLLTSDGRIIEAKLVPTIS
jgi:PIN domain nuclease of toxin-antitoxin system